MEKFLDCKGRIFYNVGSYADLLLERTFDYGKGI